MPTFLITGASRGLGLEFTKQILANSPENKVIAAARNPSASAGLQALVKANPGRLDLLTIDVSSPESVKSGIAFAGKLPSAAHGIDVLINNAGVQTAGFKSATKSSRDELDADLRTNLLGTIDVVLESLPLLRLGSLKKVLTIGSIVGSLGGPYSTSPIVAVYSVSKVALHMWVQKISVELKDEGFTFMISHPGWVKTEMGGGKDGPGDIEEEESVRGVLKYFDASTPEADNGRFFNYTGETLPW